MTNPTTTRSAASLSVSKRDRVLARVASWTVQQGVAVDVMAETIRQAVILALLEARCPGLLHPEFVGTARLPHDIASTLNRCYGETETGLLAQGLLEWEVRDASSGDHEIPLTETGLPLVLARASTARRNRGAYFTPRPLVTTLATAALAPWKNSPEQLRQLKILDPSCGDGRFLVEVARQVWLELEPPGHPDPALRREVIGNCLFGTDFDPLAVCQARTALWQAAALPGEPPATLTSHLVTADGLLDPTPGNTGQFDLVIGNPPFGSFSGRQALSIDRDLKTRYLQKWGGGGWDTLHGMFVQRGLELAGHTLALVLPTQVTHLEGYAGLRTSINKTMSLHEINDHGESVFEGEAVTPVVTMIARRDSDGRASWITTRRPDWINRVQEQGESLGRMVGDPGVHTGNCARQLVVENSDQPGRYVDVLEGRQVHPWRCDPPIKKLRLDYQANDDEYFSIRPLETYQRAPFVIRQTARHPIVGPKNTAEYFRNSLLALYEPDNGYDIRYVVGLLNSRLFRFLYTTAVRESSQSSFPQVKVRSLRDLPVIWPARDNPVQWEAYEVIVSTVKTLLDVCAVPEEARPSGAEESLRIDRLEQRIDDCVLAIYDLDENARDDVFLSG